LTESVETLERITNEKKPPLSLEEVVEKRNGLEDLRNTRKIPELKASLGKMDKEYLCGRGNLKLWSRDILAEIDLIFTKYFMVNGEPLNYLFYPGNMDYLNTYALYRADVDEVLENHSDELPVHCRTYFQYSTIWQMRGYKFPVPLGTKTVVECLHKIASERRKGFLEVRKQ
jgi:hypothetical protein